MQNCCLLLQQNQASWDAAHTSHSHGTDYMHRGEMSQETLRETPRPLTLLSASASSTSTATLCMLQSSIAWLKKHSIFGFFYPSAHLWRAHTLLLMRNVKELLASRKDLDTFSFKPTSVASPCIG